MRILFFINTLTSGGKERRLTELMKNLRSEPGVEFSLAVMSNDIHYKEVFDLGIDIHYLIRKTKKDLSVFRKLYKLCKQFKPDILHCWDSMTAIYASPVCKLLNIRLVNGMVIDTPAKRNILNTVYLRAKLTFPLSDVIIGNSKAGLAAYHAPQKKSFCIYNGFNYDRLAGLSKNGCAREQLKINTKYVIGMVASFSKHKDYKTYFRAAQLILQRRNDVTFLAIGSKTDSQEAKSLVGDEYQANFRLLGTRTDVEALVATTDICVLSTFTEGISNSILESMAMEKPVIATNGGGTSEIVLDNETGFLVGPSDPVELAGKMEILLNDAHLRTRMGTAGKQRIYDVFLINEMVKRYVAVYKNLCVT